MIHYGDITKIDGYSAPTMVSLFDGIGSFPYIWEGINGAGTALWCSEIEEFPIAVSKYHFPEGKEQICD